MLDLLIRQAQPADAGEILTLQRAAYVTEARLYGDPSLPALTQTLAELHTELSHGTALTARLGPRLVGAVRGRVRERLLHIGRLTVAPDLQGHGIGSRLLAAIEESALGEVDGYTLFTGHLSDANIRLYVRQGYTETHREQLRPGVVLVHLAKSAPG